MDVEDDRFKLHFIKKIDSTAYSCIIWLNVSVTCPLAEDLGNVLATCLLHLRYTVTLFIKKVVFFFFFVFCD